MYFGEPWIIGQFPARLAATLRAAHLVDSLAPCRRCPRVVIVDVDLVLSAISSIDYQPIIRTTITAKRQGEPQ